MGKIVIQKITDGQYHFVLKARNGEIVAASAAYASVAQCESVVNTTRCSAPVSPVEDQTASRHNVLRQPKFELYRGAQGEYRFHLRAEDGTVLLAGEGYTTKANCQNGIASVKENAPDAILIKEV